VAVKRRVAWVSFSPLEKTPAGWTSKMASVRYRLLVPAASLPAEYESKVVHLAAGANRRTLLERFQGARAVVFGKLFGPFKEDAQPILSLVQALREQGTAVLADFSDDHFADPIQGAAYQALVNGVDRVVASTPALADLVRGHTAVPVSVISDPVEGPKRDVALASQPPYRLLWFGSAQNLDTLRYGVPQLERVADVVPHSLTVMTAAGAAGPFRFLPWSVKGLWQALGECDAVVIPSNPYDPHKAVKSPNRFTESVWAGRFVIAHPLPSYQELSEYGWVGEDLGEGLRWLAANGAAAMERVRKGQAAVGERFSPRAIAGAWSEAIASTMQRS
jgi:hypothetical protein